MARLFMRLYGGLVSAVSLAVLVYVFAAPPPSMRLDRAGIPHFTPPVINPATGQPVGMAELVRHYKGER